MDKRRNFIKKTVVTTALTCAAIGTTGAIFNACSNDNKDDINAGRLTKGKSNKKEILYTKTRHWQDYYNVAT